MNTGMISMRYAKALLASAEEKKIEKTIFALMSNTIESFEQHAKLAVALKNPTLTVAQKKQLMLAAACVENEPFYEGFLDLLLQNGREDQLQRIALCFCDLYQTDARICVAQVKSAAPLPNAMLESLKKRLSQRCGRAVELKLKVDPELLGGLIIDIDGERLDASVVAQLQRIKNHLAR